MTARKNRGTGTCLAKCEAAQLLEIVLRNDDNKDELFQFLCNVKTLATK